MIINPSDFIPSDYEVDQTYLDSIMDFQNKNLDKYFPNHSEKHAKLLADMMIGTAINDEVYIYSEKLPMECYERAIKNCKANISILLEEDENIPAEIKSNSRIKIKLLNKDLLGKSPHFFVTGNSFRYETDPKIAAAVANFNNTKGAEILKQNFKILWEKSYAI